MDELDTRRSMGTQDEFSSLPVARQAAEWFLRRRNGRLSPSEKEALEQWLGASGEHATAWRQAERVWGIFSEHPLLPEHVVARREALSAVRRTQLKRWSAHPFKKFRWLSVAAAALATVGFALWWLPGGEQYSTGIGEQRTVLLDDNSRIALDALTQLRVHYDRQTRTVEILQGQAQFDVAQQVGRPFRVRAGSHLIEALGTVFTVEYVKQRVRVALIEGRIKVAQAPEFWLEAPKAIVPARISPERRKAGTELRAGEAPRIDSQGKQALEAHADLAAATAWRQGKVIFEQEPLRNAVERLNRYSRVHLEIADSSIEQWPVSGIFDGGDTEAFAEAMSQYFPIQAERAKPDVIELRRKP